MHEGEGASLMGLARVEGLDAKAGLFYAGGNAETYAGSLRRFCAEFERHEATIGLCLADRNWKACSAKFHAMKGLFATIGAAPLSEKARGLELASKNGDADACERETPGFFGAMREFGESLRAALAVPPPGDRPGTLIDPAVVAEKLAGLRRACLEGDSDVADSVSADLGTLSLGGESDGDLDEIRSLADSLDYDKAVEKIDSLLRRLNWV
ncbi:MAG: Hpt domain-containing protein [Treponema sp.]|nr:Hpt domain-containing protein [Treponema sp.]